MKFEMNIDDRKKLTARLAELTEIKSRYSGVPACVYYVGDYTVARDGSVEVEDDKADHEVINTLITEGMLKGELIQEENEELPTEDTITIGFPMAKHTGTSLRNLIHLLYSRGKLINKALGTHFKVSDGLIEVLSNDMCTVTPYALRQAVADYENEHGSSMSGLQLTNVEVSFTGFPFSGNSDRVKAYADLAELMNRMAIKQKRIQVKTVNDDNERYAMRIWLVRMGMGGERYKKSRTIILENLSGSSAFRTKAEAERFKEKQKVRREQSKCENN